MLPPDLLGRGNGWLLVPGAESELDLTMGSSFPGSTSKTKEGGNDFTPTNQVVERNMLRFLSVLNVCCLHRVAFI